MDLDVRSSLEKFFKGLVKEDESLYRHAAEGADEMPAHIRSALTDVSLNILVSAGRLLLGRWQGVFIFEHRIEPHLQKASLHLSD